MSLTGRLEEVELTEILHFLAFNAKTGRLTLSRRDGHGLVVLRLGRIVYAASTSVRETFGNILACRGLVAPEHLAEALEHQHAAADGRKLGAILVEMGRLTDEQLMEVLRQQTGLVVHELCRWKSGYFKFEVLPVASSGEIGVDAEEFVVAGGMPTDQILIEAMTRVDEEGPGNTEGSLEPTARSIASGLAAPALRGEITLGLMRRAAQVVRRGLLLVVRGDEVQGAGQFGLEGSAGGDEIARSIRLPLTEPSVFSEAVERRETWRGPLPATPTNDRLLTLLGGARPREAVVVPMLMPEGGGLVFYGDNAPEDRPIGSAEELEWALLEAGLGMERDALEHRLREFERVRGFRP